MTETDSKKGFLHFLPSSVIIILTFLLPIIFLPLNVASLDATKSIFFTTLSLLAFFIWLIFRLKDNSFKLPYNLFSLSILLVPVAYIISLFFSTNSNISLLGSGFTFDSVINVVIVFLLVAIVSVLFQDVKYANYLNVAIVASVILVTLTNILRLFLVNYLPSLNFFLNLTSNVVGKWYDLAIFASVGLIISVLSIELLKLSKNLLVGAYVATTLALLTLAIVGFSELWFVISAIFLLIFVYIYTNSRIDKIKRVPLLPLVIFLISFIFIIAGARIYPMVNSYFKIDFIEARPSLGVTFDVVKESLMEKPIFGYGPSRFDIAWTENKPVDINISDFWNTDFKFGYGFLPSLIVTTGLLGFLPWVLFLGLYLLIGLRSIFRKINDNKSKLILISSFTSSLFLWIMSFIYIPNFVTLGLTAIFTGIFVASLYREDVLKTKKIDLVSNPRIGFIYIFTLIILLTSSITISYVSISKFTGHVYYQKGIVAFSSNQTDVALNNFVKALQFDRNDIYLSALSGVENVQLVNIINSKNLSDEEKSASFQQTLTTAIQAANAAIAYDSQNYNNYLNLGSIYESLLPLNIEGVSDQAKQSYISAKDRNPINPAITLSLARLEVNGKNYNGARKLIEESLKLKPNYTEAVYLLAQIDVLEGNLKEAIAKVEQATLIKPNDPQVYFQLGLLRYQDKQYSSAIGAFENAVIRNPYYANAKYFLGLSYYQVGRNSDAVLQFEDLALMNPTNFEVKEILEKIKSGQFVIENQDIKTGGVEELPIEEGKNKGE